MRRVRPGAVAVIAVVCALLGGTAALVVGKTAGWIDDDPETVLVSSGNGATPIPARVDEEATAKPLPGNDFDAAEVYRTRANGVVTIIAVFGEESSDAGLAQGSGFVVSDDGYVLTTSHVVTTAGEGGANEQPGGGLTRSGGRPVITRRCVWLGFSSLGIDRNSASV